MRPTRSKRLMRWLRLSPAQRQVTTHQSMQLVLLRQLEGRLTYKCIKAGCQFVVDSGSVLGLDQVLMDQCLLLL